jgi:AraC family transcriptional regulator
MAPIRPKTARAERLRLSYLYGGIVTYQAGEALGPRLLTDFELVLILEGQPTYYEGGAAHRLAPDSVVLARPGFRERYVWDPRRRTRHAYFHFGIEALPEEWPEPQHWPVVRRRAEPAAVALFRHILEMSSRLTAYPAAPPPPEETRLVEALIGILLARPRPHAGADDTSRPEPVRRALKWMRELLDDESGRATALAEISRKSGVTPKHLCRVFQQSVGHAPMETFRLLRLQLAVALLVRSNLAVKEVAARCGFEDPLHFSRCFSKAFGRSPRRMRDDLRRGKPPPPNPLPADLMPRMYW